MVTLAEGREDSAVSYPEFVEGLYRRKEFPDPVNHWAALPKKDKSST